MFDSGTKHPDNRIHLFDPVELINDSYGSYNASSYTLQPRNPTKSYDHSFQNSNSAIRSFDHSIENYNKNSGELRFSVVTSLGDESDVYTPRLWKPNSATNPKGVAKSMNPNHHHQTMSPSSRTQAIAKGRRELMEMVRDLPESFYELSLKDIVEQKPDMEVQKEINLPEENKAVKETSRQRTSGTRVKKSESKKKIVRSTSVDNGGFLLKTSVFPIWFGARRSKRSLGAASSFKVAPVPKPQSTQNGSVKSVEKEWWRRRSCISSETEDSNGLSSKSTSTRSSSSSSSSRRSNSSNGRRKSRCLPTCCFFNGKRIDRKKQTRSLT